MRFLDIVRSAIANSFRSKTRTALTVIAIVIGAFTLTITSAIGAGVSDYIDTQVSAIGQEGVMTVVKTTEAAPADGGPAVYDDSAATATAGAGEGGIPGSSVAALTTDDITTIEGIDGVRSVDPTVRILPDYITTEGSDRYVLSLNPAAALTKADLAAGDQLGSSDAGTEILLPDSYVESLGFSDADAAVGATVSVAVTDYAGEQRTVDATVVGVQNTTLFATGASIGPAMTTALLDAQNTGRPDSIATVYASATAVLAGDASDEEIAAVKTALSDAGFTGTTVADQLGTFQTVVDGIIGVLNAFAVIALIAAGFGIINTLLMSVQERTREIGLMKAMGLGGGRIFTLFSFEAIFIGFLGSAIGAALAAGIGTLISDGLSTTLLADLPGLNIMLFEPGSIAVIVLVVMGIAFLAGTLPARRAAAQNPIDALRYE